VKAKVKRNQTRKPCAFRLEDRYPKSSKRPDTDKQSYMKNLMIRLHHQYQTFILRSKMAFPKIDQNLYKR